MLVFVQLGSTERYMQLLYTSEPDYIHVSYYILTVVGIYVCIC